MVYREDHILIRTSGFCNRASTTSEMCFRSTATNQYTHPYDSAPTANMATTAAAPAWTHASSGGTDNTNWRRDVQTQSTTTATTHSHGTELWAFWAGWLFLGSIVPSVIAFMVGLHVRKEPWRLGNANIVITIVSCAVCGGDERDWET